MAEDDHAEKLRIIEEKIVIGQKMITVVYRMTSLTLVVFGDWKTQQ